MEAKLLNNLGYDTFSDYSRNIYEKLSRYSTKIVKSDGTVKYDIVETSYFLDNDVWHVDFFSNIEQFKDQYAEYDGDVKSIQFTSRNPDITNEMKYFAYNKLFNDEWVIRTFFSQRYHFTRFASFMNERYPRVKSILELNYDKASFEWVNWLEENKYITSFDKDQGVKSYKYKSAIANFFKKIYQTLNHLTDVKIEWEKDVWDVRNLEFYGISYNHSRHDFFIKFTNIENEILKQTLKRYLKQRLLSERFSWSSASKYALYVTKFFNFITKKEPQWNDLKALKRHHMMDFIQWISEYSSNRVKQRNSNPTYYKIDMLTRLEKFLTDIQWQGYEIAPTENIKRIILPNDRPKAKKKSHTQIDHIPEFVLEQLFSNINELHKEVQPVIWVMYKTGLRISDVLGLNHDCLIRLNEKYWIETDIEKTYVEGHRIPIDDELANLISVLIEKSRENSDADNNPHKYIFVRYRGQRKGKPFAQSWISGRLNELAKKCSIVDENGQLFYFKNHSFRHTYAIKMLNSGTDIITVQELLAHASPEMTMRYARLLDNTKREAFENAINQGVFTFDLNGKIYNATEKNELPTNVLEMLWKDHKLTAIDNPYGSCRARINGDCPYAEEPPCLTCNGGKPCKDLAVGLSDMDLAKYEIHIQSTSKMIEAAKQYGRDEIAMKNEKNLERLQGIYDTIKGGNIVFGRLERIKRKTGVSIG